MTQLIVRRWTVLAGSALFGALFSLLVSKTLVPQVFHSSTTIQTPENPPVVDTSLARALIEIQLIEAPMSGQNAPNFDWGQSLAFTPAGAVDGKSKLFLIEPGELKRLDGLRNQSEARTLAKLTVTSIDARTASIELVDALRLVLFPRLDAEAGTVRLELEWMAPNGAGPTVSGNWGASVPIRNGQTLFISDLPSNYSQPRDNNTLLHLFITVNLLDSNGVSLQAK